MRKSSSFLALTILVRISHEEDTGRDEGFRKRLRNANGSRHYCIIEVWTLPCGDGLSFDTMQPRIFPNYSSFVRGAWKQDLLPSWFPLTPVWSKSNAIEEQQ